jgi:diphthamide synthase (EF-2-diphthine--ammonia ligase)
MGIREKGLALMELASINESKARSIARMVKSPSFLSKFLKLNEDERKRLQEYIQKLDTEDVRHILNGATIRDMREQARTYGLANYSRLSKDQLNELITQIEGEYE